MKGLLQKEAPKRLGYGASGSADVRSHPFFKPVNWGKLERREVGRCIQERCSSGGEDEWGGGGERSRERMCTPAHVAAPAPPSRPPAPTPQHPQVPSPFRPTIRSVESVENFDKIWTDLPVHVSLPAYKGGSGRARVGRTGRGSARPPRARVQPHPPTLQPAHPPQLAGLALPHAAQPVGGGKVHV